MKKSIAGEPVMERYLDFVQKRLVLPFHPRSLSDREALLRAVELGREAARRTPIEPDAAAGLKK